MCQRDVPSQCSVAGRWKQEAVRLAGGGDRMPKGQKRLTARHGRKGRPRKVVSKAGSQLASPTGEFTDGRRLWGGSGVSERVRAAGKNNEEAAAVARRLVLS